MSESVELSTLDLRYEGYRLRDSGREARLLASLAERGIEQPLEGVDAAEGRFLLNGFKRYRCARKLGIDCAPYRSLGQEEAIGIMNLMCMSGDKSLGILEQARFIVDLLTLHELSVAELAQRLSRSKGWISMRRALLEEMSPGIQEVLFRGDFPVYCYMYTLRPFRRMNSEKRDQVERFVHALAGRRLSVRDVERLAQAYFRGPDSLREAIDCGKFRWSLEQIKSVPQDREGCTELERVLLQDLQSLRKQLERVMTKCDDPRLTSRAFHAQAHLLACGLLHLFEPCRERMKQFHDRCGRA